MDVTMPHLDGIEATRRILAELPNTLVVGLSMHEQQSMAAAMHAAGAAIYLPKDGPADALIKAIRSSTDPAAGQNPLGILTP
jgi:DNA-binding NarL/FixJ family response regulator